MKWYNKENMQRYKFDVSYPTLPKSDEEKMIQHFTAWTPKIAIQFSREYAAIGTLDINDLIQMGNLHMVQAVKALDWSIIDGAVNEEKPAIIWSYVKNRIKKGIRKEIDYNKDPMRSHRMDGSKRSNAPIDNFLTQLFPDFFEGNYEHIIDVIDTSSWDIEQLSIGLEIAMDEVLTFKEKDILKSFYGVDSDRESIRSLAHRYQMSEIGIRKGKDRSILKLQENKETREIIENYYYI